MTREEDKQKSEDKQEVERLITEIAAKLGRTFSEDEKNQYREYLCQHPYPYHHSMRQNYLDSKEAKISYLSDHPSLHGILNFFWSDS